MTQADFIGGASRQDYYAILGVLPNATVADIRKAYREQALRWHPDKAGNGDDAKERFQAISRAHEILADTGTRQRYDAQQAAFAKADSANQRAARQRRREAGEQRAAAEAAAFVAVFGTGMQGRPTTPAPPSAAEAFAQSRRTPARDRTSFEAARARSAHAARAGGSAEAPAARASPPMARRGERGGSAQAPVENRFTGYTYANGTSAQAAMGSATTGYMDAARVPPQVYIRSPQNGYRDHRTSAPAGDLPAAAPNLATASSSPSNAWATSADAPAETVRKSQAKAEQRPKTTAAPAGSPTATSPRASLTATSPRAATRSSAAAQPSATSPRSATRSSAAAQPSARDDLRPTAAEVHPEGFNQPDFRASFGDLRALATFDFAGRTWQPQEIRDIEWGRPKQAPRCIRITFSADFLVPLKGNSGAPTTPDFDLQQSSVREVLQAHFKVLQAHFKAHLDAVTSPEITKAFMISVGSRIANGSALLPGGGIPVEFRISLEGEPADMLNSFRLARKTGPALKAKECPLM